MSNKSSVLSGSLVASDGETTTITLPFSIQDTTINEFSTVETYTLAPSATAQTVAMGRVTTAKYAAFVADAAFGVDVDASGTYDLYNPVAVITGTHTGFLLSNPSSTATVCVKVLVAGTR